MRRPGWYRRIRFGAIRCDSGMQVYIQMPCELDTTRWSISIPFSGYKHLSIRAHLVVFETRGPLYRSLNLCTETNLKMVTCFLFFGYPEGFFSCCRCFSDKSCSVTSAERSRRWIIYDRHGAGTLGKLARSLYRILAAFWHKKACMNSIIAIGKAFEMLRCFGVSVFLFLVSRFSFLVPSPKPPPLTGKKYHDLVIKEESKALQWRGGVWLKIGEGAVAYVFFL